MILHNELISSVMDAKPMSKGGFEKKNSFFNILAGFFPYSNKTTIQELEKSYFLFLLDF